MYFKHGHSNQPTYCCEVTKSCIPDGQSLPVVVPKMGHGQGPRYSSAWSCKHITQVREVNEAIVVRMAIVVSPFLARKGLPLDAARAG